MTSHAFQRPRIARGEPQLLEHNDLAGQRRTRSTATTSAADEAILNKIKQRYKKGALRAL